ncbi:hypothetical protein EDB81DRAFT_362230 [Dactylonectria macrodidyma]|uniref:Uncharacterized protein n=1 Tax=Dactylonectria macrodidyma TaxID=307937 RepID=A0A9P9D2X2_9HYPO|nr:hypothetical protein EDB81DRAFT_362230 [Dactylonectria macrodidyma]
MSSSDHASDKPVTQNSSKPASANHPILLHKLAQACLAEGQNEDAINLLMSELSHSQPGSSDQVMSELDLAAAYMIDRRPKDAIDLLELRTQIEHITRERICTPKGWKYTPGDYLQIYILRRQYLAQAYLAHDREQDGIDCLEQLTSMVGRTEPTMMRLIHHCLARAYLANGRIKDAIKSLELVPPVERGKDMIYPLQAMLEQDLDAAKDADKHSEQELTGASKDDPELSGLKLILWAFQTQGTLQKLTDAMRDDFHEWNKEKHSI